MYNPVSTPTKITSPQAGKQGRGDPGKSVFYDLSSVVFIIMFIIFTSNIENSIYAR